MSNRNTSINISNESFIYNAPINREEEFDEARGWGDYINLKYHKLEQQFRGNTKQNAAIFSDLIAFISTNIQEFTSENGSENYNYQKIAGLFLSHGGKTSHYIDSSVTHYISPSIPVYFQRKLDGLKKSLIMVKPNWVVDSVSQNKRLPVSKYLLHSAPLTSFFNENIQNVENPSNNNAIANPNKKRKLLTSKQNPNFVKDYFSSSRLHFLSTWKTNLKKKLEDLVTVVENDEFELKHSVVSSAPIIVHIDMDAFFVSVSTRDRPDLHDKPVVICHGGDRGVCASVNYVSRKLGISNGDWLYRVKQICGPDLVILPYDFDAYEKVSFEMYNIFTKYTKKIQVVSCDEAFLDITSYVDSLDLAKSLVDQIRSEIKKVTKCSCSAGIGNTKIMASMALKKAKPNGIYIAPPSEDLVNIPTQYSQLSHILQTSNVLDLENESISWISQFKVSELPGIGYSISKKLRQMEIEYVKDLQVCDLAFLRKTFGDNKGVKLYLTCRGADVKSLDFINKRKSIGVELSYAVRFDKIQQVYNFIKDMVQELHHRLLEEDASGKTFTMNVYKKKESANQLENYLGHGPCTVHSKTHTAIDLINDPSIIYSIGIKLFRQFNVKPDQVRGLGLHVTKLSYGKSVQNKTIKNLFQTNNNTSNRPFTLKKLKNVNVETKQKDKAPNQVCNKQPYTVFHRESIDDIINSITNIIASGQNPLPLHSELIQQYCHTLITQGFLEDLYLLLKTIKRFSFKYTSWKDKLNCVIKLANIHVKSHYGYSLYI